MTGIPEPEHGSAYDKMRRAMGGEPEQEDLGPTPEDFERAKGTPPRESHAEARVVAQRAGDYLREFMLNGFTRDESLMYIAQMLPHGPHH
ncbi:hypothetical protein SEA_SUPPI_42 [Arthrobacter phage Suppi]|uniref:Uncharacterized protein n=5 Tax=Korravirus TaxID=1982076 RepID=A0A1D8ESU0_9CAUD|nr:hypothetical protein FDH63_gp42 [Arthrobacter phage Wayne]YP_010050211.1 hypothetical protein KDJ02_gp42 [Arthrobacter phage Litotes]AOT24070.1 hypothetical protein SEA_SUPPI_42 [Arthrobacter phage Suppi]ASR83277.1 hypothetical protein SEA_CANOWICAKTE_42 [Arthrobacter phage Canowicakte]AZF97678.1 hypothetical protein SEA_CALLIEOMALLEY_42 [Arthrobacter phage CallieOMalley]QHB47211.1 hypothetical protein SEA_APPLECIDER_42 [Arthrobacter phage AppleCider]ALY10766.1 hypothetical protein PBI_WAY